MKEIVEKIVVEKVDGTRLFLIDMVVQKNKVEIYMDGDGGISLEDCTSINRMLHTELEKLNVDIGQYIVEVSSPGLDRDVKDPRGFKNNVGHGMRIRNKQSKYISGKIAFASSKGVMLVSGNQKKKMEFIKYSDIEEAKAVI